MQFWVDFYSLARLGFVHGMSGSCPGLKKKVSATSLTQKHASLELRLTIQWFQEYSRQFLCTTKPLASKKALLIMMETQRVRNDVL